MNGPGQVDGNALPILVLQRAMNTRQPAIYIPHGGGPWPFMEDPNLRWKSLATYLQQLPDSLPRVPRAVLIVTAHWEAVDFTIASGRHPQLIYDYYGFPTHTYELTYAPSGEPSVAARAAALADSAGIPTRLDADYGWDHGVFVPLAIAWPDADIPVVATSLKHGLDPLDHIEFGAALEPLRDENVVIIGSGLSVHDLSFRVTPEQAGHFDAWLEESMALEPEDRTGRLAKWADAPGARASHPREEHLLPLMTVVGAGGDDGVRRTYHDTMFGLPVAAYTFD